MSEPIVHRFRASELRVYPSTEYCETVFPDGTKAPATRECEVGNAAYARHLGYDDCWTALVEHEAGHTLLAERLGHLQSPTLWAVAHGYGEGCAPYEIQLWEEAAVLALQRYARTKEVLPILRHPDLRPHFSRWAWELRGLTARLLDRSEAA